MTATRNADGEQPSTTWIEGQTPIALIGALAITILLAIGYLSRPQLTPTDSRLMDTTNCQHCGTVVAIRRSAHSVPVYYVEVRMPDGSTFTVRELVTALSVGDVVEVRGTALTPRDIF